MFGLTCKFIENFKSFQKVYSIISIAFSGESFSKMRFRILFIVFVPTLIYSGRAEALFEQFISEDLTVVTFSNGINEIVLGFFIKKFSNVNIIKTNDSTVNQIVSVVLLKTAENKYTTCVETLNNLKTVQRTDRKKFLVLVVVESTASLIEFKDNFNMNRFSRNAFFLIAITNEKSDDAVEIFKWFWKNNFYNVNILIGGVNNLELLTFYPFSVIKCQTPTVVKMNEFNAKTRRWNNDSFYPNKFKNMHQCVFLHSATKPDVVRKANGELRGPVHEIVDTLASILNFTSKHKLMDAIGQIYSNGSGTQVLKEIYDKRIQITSASIQLERTQILSESYPFLIDALMLVIPPGYPLTPLEKLYKTFDKKVWIGIVGVFLIAMLMMKLLTKFIKDSHDTSGNSTVSMINAFLGGSIEKHNLPSSHFSRFSLSIFLIYALIIRTAYIGILFEYLRFEVKHNEVSNVDEMNEENFKFFAYESLMPRLIDFKFYNRYQFTQSFECLI